MRKRSPKTRLALLLPDTHFAPPNDPNGGVDEEAFSCALKIIRLTSPNIIYHMGDVGEWSSVSPWQYKKKSRPPLTYVLQALEADANAVNAYLDRIDEAAREVNCTTKHIIEGNHEVWINNLIEEVPELASSYSPQKLMNLSRRRWKYHPYGKYVKLGKLSLYHGGHFGGIHHARSHLLHLGTSVVYGHYHDAQVAKIGHLSGYHGAWSIGCLAKMDKPFLKGRPTNWSHNVALVHVESNGEFFIDVVNIYKGRAYVWGEEVKGN